MTEHTHDYIRYTGAGILIAGLLLVLVLAGYNRHDIQALAVNASVANVMGPLGAWMAHHLRMSFGYTSAMFCVIAFAAAWQLLRRRSTDRHWKQHSP
jgi:hypothetical protein